MTAAWSSGCSPRTISVVRWRSSVGSCAARTASFRTISDRTTSGNLADRRSKIRVQAFNRKVTRAHRGRVVSWRDCRNLTRSHRRKATRSDSADRRSVSLSLAQLVNLHSRKLKRIGQTPAPPRRDRDFRDRGAVMGVDHLVGRGDDGRVLGGKSVAPAEQQHVAGVQSLARDWRQMPRAPRRPASPRRRFSAQSGA